MHGQPPRSSMSHLSFVLPSHACLRYLESSIDNVSLQGLSPCCCGRRIIVFVQLQSNLWLDAAQQSANLAVLNTSAAPFVADPPFYNRTVTT